MSAKTENSSLLKENTIRRFMKLANVNSLTDNFISEKYTRDDDSEPDQEEETVEEQMEPEDELAAAEPGDEEAAGDDMDMDMDMGGEDDDMPGEELGAADISLTEEEARLLIDLGDRLKEAMGSDMDMDDDMGSGEEELDLDAPDDDMEPEEGAPELDQDEVVQEVLRRVTKRLMASRNK